MSLSVAARFRDSATLKYLEIFKNKFSVYSRTIDKKIGGRKDETRDGPDFKNQLWLNYCPAGYIIVEIITTGGGNKWDCLYRISS